MNKNLIYLQNSLNYQCKMTFSTYLLLQFTIMSLLDKFAKSFKDNAFRPPENPMKYFDKIFIMNKNQNTTKPVSTENVAKSSKTNTKK